MTVATAGSTATRQSPPPLKSRPGAVAPPRSSEGVEDDDGGGEVEGVGEERGPVSAWSGMWSMSPRDGNAEVLDRCRKQSGWVWVRARRRARGGGQREGGARTSEGGLRASEGLSSRRDALRRLSGEDRTWRQGPPMSSVGGAARPSADWSSRISALSWAPSVLLGSGAVTRVRFTATSVSVPSVASPRPRCTMR